MKTIKILILSLSLISILFSQIDDSLGLRLEDQFVEKGFLILKSTKDYNEALNFVKEVSKKLEIKIDLRDLSPNEKTGLSFPDSICMSEFGQMPCYVARGRWDDGVYLSIEYSNAYDKFKSGYYIVIAASDFKENNTLKATLKKVKENISDAYIKYTKVYVGCMH